MSWWYHKFSFFIDQQHCRYTFGMKCLLVFRLTCPLRQFLRKNDPWQFFPLDKLSDRCNRIGWAFPNIDGNNFKSLVVVLFVGFQHAGNRRLTGWAPCCREFYQNVLSSKTLPIEIYVIQCFAVQGDIRTYFSCGFFAYAFDLLLFPLQLLCG